MARLTAYGDAPPAEARSYRRSSTPTAEHESLPQPEVPTVDPCETDPRDFEADYTEDRSIAVLAERRRQALANDTRSFVDVDLP